MANATKISESLRCDLCEKTLTSKKDLRRHIDAVHGGKKDFLCNICNMTFTQISGYDKHQRSVHENPSTQKKYSVTNARKRFFYKTDLAYHIFVDHDGNRFQCEECNATFTRKFGLSTHRKTVHMKISNYKCRFCGKLFSQKSNLNTHINAAHINEKNHACDTCDKTFKSLRQLRIHIDCVHNKIKKYSCHICDKRFAQSSNRDQHMSIHSDSERSRFKCETCGKTFANKQYLKNHREREHLSQQIREVKCEYCGKNVREWNLKRHQVNMHDKQLRENKCEICGKIFARNGNYERHLTNAHIC